MPLSSAKKAYSSALITFSAVLIALSAALALINAAMRRFLFTKIFFGKNDVCIISILNFELLSNS